MPNLKLGRLIKYEDLRSIWPSEAADFTPWLAQEENISLLGDAIGIELEVEAQETNVGPFRADILCKNTANGTWVLIENQLERTDHTHLGQLMTYAAGLKAVTIVWIAERFTEEHRAALDWLNEITDDRFNFFGLEIELWQIGDSDIAPKFNIVSKPNDWSRTVTGAAKRIDTDELSETKLLQLEYWTDLRKLLLDKNSIVNPQKPLPQHWANFAIGRSYFYLIALVNTREKRVSCGLVITGPDSKSHFKLLEQEREAIEAAFGKPLDWRENPEKIESQIYLHQNNADPTNRDDWAAQHDWLALNLEGFHKAFSQRVKKLSSTFANFCGVDL